MMSEGKLWPTKAKPCPLKAHTVSVSRSSKSCYKWSVKWGFISQGLCYICYRTTYIIAYIFIIAYRCMHVCTCMYNIHDYSYWSIYICQRKFEAKQVMNRNGVTSATPDVSIAKAKSSTARRRHALRHQPNTKTPLELIHIIDSNNYIYIYIYTCIYI